MLRGDVYLVKHSKPGKKGHTHLKLAWDDQKTVKSFVVPNLLPTHKGEKRLALYLGRYPKGASLKTGKGIHKGYDVSKKRIGRAIKIGPGKYELPDDVWLLKMGGDRYLLNKTK